MLFSVKSSEEAVELISAQICESLALGSVLWLVSGGSAVVTQVKIMQELQLIAADSIGRLMIVPVDERFGPKGHADSNSEQMKLAGFESGEASWYDVLDQDLPYGATLLHYAELVEELLEEADSIIATLGLGTDGHTAGILPQSPAITNVTAAVVGYDWSDYNRMTLSIPSLQKITQAFVLAYGESKEAPLEQLRENKEPLSLLPAKLLYDVPSVTVYNDCITNEG